MPFVEEKISEADRAKIDWSRFKSFGKPLDPLSVNKWIIDRDRSIFVIGLSSDFDDG
ncbi:MAG: hypothetical protein I8H92_02515, partial [Moraxellaceae bacterium]|nr:hypothetical protein [Moraxellaceae bacterium]